MRSSSSATTLQQRAEHDLGTNAKAAAAVCACSPFQLEACKRAVQN
jgi:hypothetical protein